MDRERTHRFITGSLALLSALCLAFLSQRAPLVESVALRGETVAAGTLHSRHIGFPWMVCCIKSDLAGGFLLAEMKAPLRAALIAARTLDFLFPPTSLDSPEDYDAVHVRLPQSRKRGRMGRQT